jgi:hypothetical protein
MCYLSENLVVGRMPCGEHQKQSTADQIKKEPAMEIAGLCLPLKPQKEKFRINSH